MPDGEGYYMWKSGVPKFVCTEPDFGDGSFDSDSTEEVWWNPLSWFRVPGTPLMVCANGSLVDDYANCNNCGPTCGACCTYFTGSGDGSSGGSARCCTGCGQITGCGAGEANPFN